MNNKSIGTVKTRSGVDVPLLGIPMMSDDRWQELVRENAVHNYTKHFGRAPEDTQTAVMWQRNWLASIV